MPANNPISLPAGYASAFAVGYAGASGELALVDSANPLPVQTMNSSPGPTPSPLEGMSSADLLAGPFSPARDTPVILTLNGQWEGSVQVERSVDGGTTRHKLTAAGLPWGLYTTNACEAVWSEAEDQAELYLDITISSGTLSYRLAQ